MIHVAKRLGGESRMDEQYGGYQQERSLAFQRFTGRKGLPLTYGTGEPGRLTPGWKPAKKGQP